MLSLPTTTVTVLRGTTLDKWGDETDDDSPYLTGVPASVLEQTMTVREADSAIPMTVRTTTARVAFGTDVTDSDRIKDETTGQTYVIESVTATVNPLVSTDIRLELKRVG